LRKPAADLERQEREQELPMDVNTRKKLIEQYKDGYRVVAEALAGAPDEELDTAPAPGKWTARQIAHHLADSEMTSAIRLRLLIASPNPQILGYDQEEFARRLYYADRPIEASVDAFSAARRTTAELLDRLSEAEWLREGTHSEHGRYTVQRWLEIYAPHAHAHATQILAARDAARKKKLEQKK
jgi:DinB superfamily